MKLSAVKISLKLPRLPEQLEPKLHEVPNLVNGRFGITRQALFKNCAWMMITEQKALWV
jgi:hypothetical protein